MKNNKFNPTRNIILTACQTLLLAISIVLLVVSLFILPFVVIGVFPFGPLDCYGGGPSCSIPVQTFFIPFSLGVFYLGYFVYLVIKRIKNAVSDRAVWIAIIMAFVPILLLIAFQIINLPT